MGQLDERGAPPGARARWATAAAVVALLAAAALLLRRLYEISQTPGITSYDIYSYVYPMLLRAGDAVRHGGAGLLWNADQNCGQPLLGIGTSGILYPPSWFFFVLPGDQALYGLLFCNLAIAALGAYGLGRALGVSRVAAVCGGLTFAFSNQGVDLITFTPIVSGPYAWLPVAMLCTERLLHTARPATAVALAATLAVSLLPGHPQVIVYLYQLIALRVAWELLVARPARPLRLLGLFGLSLGVAPLFAAAHLLPAVESMRLSIRGSGLTPDEMTPGGSATLRGWRSLFTMRREINNPLHLLPTLLACGALLTRGARRQAVFYAAIAVLSLLLALGDNGLLFPLYRRLPAGALFRDPARFLWITSLCLSVLVSLGADALTRGQASATRRGRGLAVALPVAALAALWAISLSGLLPHERWLVGALIAAIVLAASLPRAALLSGVVLAAVLALELTWLRPPPFRHLLPDGSQLYARRPLFETLAQRLTPQDRVYLVPKQLDHTLQHKTGSLFGAPMVFDYESQPSRRWGEFFTRLRVGRPMRTINDVMYPIEGWLPPSLNRPLLNLTASRFLIIYPVPDNVRRMAQLGMPLLHLGGGAQIYENRAALPRAQWVPRAEVIADPPALLEALAGGAVDPRRVVLLETAPPSGDLGAPGEAGGAVSFTRNDPEDIVLEVIAPAAGFLVLADQHFPGWRATVNGAAAPLLRANYAFRAVPVPAGHSTVAFRFRPPSVALGAAISAASIVAALVGLAIARHRRGGVTGDR